MTEREQRRTMVELVAEMCELPTLIGSLTQIDGRSALALARSFPTPHRHANIYRRDVDAFRPIPQRAQRVRQPLARSRCGGQGRGAVRSSDPMRVVDCPLGTVAPPHGAGGRAPI